MKLEFCNHLRWAFCISCHSPVFGDFSKSLVFLPSDLTRNFYIPFHRSRGPKWLKYEFNIGILYMYILTKKFSEGLKAPSASFRSECSNTQASKLIHTPVFEPVVEFSPRGIVRPGNFFQCGTCFRRCLHLSVKNSGRCEIESGQSRRGYYSFP